MNSLSRRSFLKLCLSSLLGLGFRPRPAKRKGYFPLPGPIARIAADEKIISIYREPDPESEVVRETNFDELLNIYYTKYISDAENHAVETHQHAWYRVWGGWLPGAYVQETWFRRNSPLYKIPDCGKLAEVTVPYTDALAFQGPGQWERKYRLYYGTTHWITGLKKGPDDTIWYELTSQLAESLIYYVKREHLRPIPDSEFIPLSIHVPPEEKRIEVSLSRQQMTAFEYDQPVRRATISTGLGFREVPRGTATPTGNFSVTSKYPTKHMGSIVYTGAPGGYTLPGVPWTTFFIYETGVAFHGTYWHGNFGHKMSHGCVNMRNEDAKWLFRWTTPSYEPPYRGHCDWESIPSSTNPSTRIDIFHNRD